MTNLQLGAVEAKFADIIASCKYDEGTSDCLNDHRFTRDDGSVIFYHSDCGTFNDCTANRSYDTLDEQQAQINELLKSLFEAKYS